MQGNTKQRFQNTSDAFSLRQSWGNIQGRQFAQQAARRASGADKKACEVAAALVCTLSQNGYGDGGVFSLLLGAKTEALEGAPLVVGGWREGQAWRYSKLFADGHTELNAPDLF